MCDQPTQMAFANTPPTPTPPGGPIFLSSSSPFVPYPSFPRIPSGSSPSIPDTSFPHMLSFLFTLRFLSLIFSSRHNHWRQAFTCWQKISAALYCVPATSSIYWLWQRAQHTLPAASSNSCPICYERDLCISFVAGERLHAPLNKYEILTSSIVQHAASAPDWCPPASTPGIPPLSPCTASLPYLKSYGQ